ELGDAFGVADGVGFAPEVDEGDKHLAAVIGVDGAGCVGDGDAVPGGEAGAGADLALVAVGDSDGETERDAGDGPGGDGHRGAVRVAREAGGEVEAGGAGGRVGGDEGVGVEAFDAHRGAGGAGLDLGAGGVGVGLGVGLG